MWNKLVKHVEYSLWSTGSKDPQNTDVDTTFEVKEPEFKVHVSPSSSAKTKKHAGTAKREAKIKSPVELTTGVRNLSKDFKDFSFNNTNGVNAANMPALEDITYLDAEEAVGERLTFLI
nr:hypothetical protein [Tanacetum cinerariifolium]